MAGPTGSTSRIGGPRHEPFGPLLLDFPKAPACYCLRCPLGRAYPECLVGGKGLGGGYAPLGAVFASEDLVPRAAELGARLRKAPEALEEHPSVAQAIDAAVASADR